MKGDYHVIVEISEQEFWEVAHNNDVKGVPVFYCMSRNGAVRFYPQLDQTKVALLYAWEKMDEGVGDGKSRVRGSALRQAFRRFWR